MFAVYYRKSLATVMMLALILVGSLFLTAYAEAHSPSSRLRFYSQRDDCGKSKCLIKSISITGTNQRNQRVTWHSGTLQKPVYSITTSNWWWKPNAGAMITVDYSNDLQGALTCRVVGEPFQTRDGYPTWWHIADTGGPVCESKFDNYTYVLW